MMTFICPQCQTPTIPVPVYAWELAQKILDMVKEVDDKWLTVTETYQRDLLMAVVDDIEKLCKEQLGDHSVITS